MSHKKMLATIIILLILSLMSVKAERFNDQVRLNIPFRVKVGDVTLQPGEYVIDQFNSPSTRNLLIIQSKNGHLKVENSVFTIWTRAAKVPEEAKVVFRKVGDWHFFDTVWVPGKEMGYHFPPSDFEKQVRRELALKTTSRRAEMAAAQPLPSRPAEEDTAKIAERRARTETEPSPSAPPEQRTEPAPSVQRTEPSVQSTGSVRTALPRTATSLPLLGAFGLLILAIGIGLRKLL